MKKLLLLIMCVFTLVACNQENEMFVEETRTQSVLENDSLELRSGVDFFHPSNMISLYEYLAFSGTGEIIDAYYTTELKSSPFYDSQSGQTFYYQRNMGKIGKEPLPYKGIYLNRVVYGLQYYYEPGYSFHMIFMSNYCCPHGDYTDGFHKTCDLGYTVLNITSEDRATFLANGTWKYLHRCFLPGTSSYRYFALSPYESLPSGWKQTMNSEVGIIVVK